MGGAVKNTASKTRISVNPTAKDGGDLALTVSAAHAKQLAASYSDQIRLLLETVDRFRNLMVMKEGIHFPTIVVVGDQSSGKLSILKSLAGINLPCGQGTCTRDPLIMRLQDNPYADCPELYTSSSTAKSSTRMRITYLRLLRLPPKRSRAMGRAYRMPR
ncbi:uncharacterized protein J3R85_014169 [Psidium guajava]|nr:uncharacterized protein J3R85_014169 [Psidium guajava]